MKSTRKILVSLSLVLPAYSELLVYEPFDDAPHNDETFGRLHNRNGGLGFSGPWQDCEGRGNDGHAFIYDQRGNPKDLYNGDWGSGLPEDDGKVDNLPTMGGYAGLSDWGGGDRLNSKRKLAKIACSAIFLSGRDEESILNDDVHADQLSELEAFDLEIDYANQSVTASFHGMVSRTGET